MTIRAMCLYLMMILLPITARAQSIAPLVPVADATYLAVATGEWSNPTTWDIGVPGLDAKVHIPAGITVTVDQEFTVPLFWVRVDGTLKFALAVPTKLTVDSVFVMNGGRVEMGTQAAPITSTSALVIHARNGQPINQAWDFSELSRGLVSDHMATVEIAHVQVRTPLVSVTQIPAGGSNTVTATTAPVGWQVGDKVVFTGSSYDTDTEHTITAMNGATVTVLPGFGGGRTFPANAVANGAALHLANLTRGLRIETLAGNAGNIPLQGHVMLMHAGGHKIYNAGFYHLGRTKTAPVNDPIMVNGVREASLMPLCGLSVENIRGRYPLHFHRAGPFAALSVADGIAIQVQRRATLKIGVINHSSNVAVRNAVSHQIDGTHFATEEGDEIGEWTNLIAIHSNGKEVGGFDHDLNVQCTEANYPEIHHRRRMNVMGLGYGYWLHGGGVVVDGAISAGNENLGLSVWSRGLDFQLNNTYDVKFPTALLRDGGAWANGLDYISIDAVPFSIKNFHAYGGNHNERYAAAGALEVKFNGMKNTQDYPGSPHSLIENLISWNNMNGVITAYAGHVHYTNLFMTQGASINPRTSNGRGMQLAVQGGNNNIVHDSQINNFQDFCVGPSATDTFFNATCNGVPYP